MSLIFVDCESVGPSVSTGRLTEFGAVEFSTRRAFHGIIENSKRGKSRRLETDPPPVVGNDAGVFKGFFDWVVSFDPPQIFISDNPAYDWQWINDGFHRHVGGNPFGHSARRIGDFYAGLAGNWRASSNWKRFRRTPHDHNPVHDALGNVEAFEEIVRRYAPRRLKGI